MRPGTPSSTSKSGLGLFWVPLAPTLAVFALSFLPRVQLNHVLTRSFWGATVMLLLWQAVLFLRMKQAATRPSLVLAGPRAQHYVQAMCQLSVYVYWGWYWRPVYDYAWLLIAQLVFAYAFDMLLSWSRRGSYVLGFGPFPIIFSTNLFLWFRDDWFPLQFLLIAVGFMGKEFVRWQREGRNVHIFNPSAFSLGLFSLILIVTNTTHLTRGQEIATTLSLAPHIYLFLFLVGLVVMYFFSITLVAACAAATLFGMSALYSSVTGVPYFLDSEIPTAVFLGLHLLVTDPSTSPRTPLGRLVFGILYGLGVFSLYSLLGAIGAPTFYDKLLCVPLLNVSVPWIDRAVRAIGEKPLLSRLGLAGPLGRFNLAHMTVWITVFATMTAVGATDGMHRGDSVPFWQQACAEGRTSACARLVAIESSYCGDNAGWACNELGGHYREGRIVAVDAERALWYFAKACELRFQAGCFNLLDPHHFIAAAPRVFDLRLLLRERGPNLTEMREPDLYARACAHGWTYACDKGPPSSTSMVNRREIRTAVVASAASSQPSRLTPPALLPAFVEIGAGPFVMGSDPGLDPLAFDNEKWSRDHAQGTVDLPAFYISRYEVTIEQFQAFVDTTAFKVDSQTFRGRARDPVTNVSWPDTLAYCRWLEKELRISPNTPPRLGQLLRDGWHVTLPSEAEWEKAARGTDGRIFPWGNTPRADRANYEGSGVMPVGSFTCSECPYPLSDMSGNVWEWTRSPYQPYPYDPTADRADLEADALWVMRGGHFGDPARNVRAATRGGADPGARRSFIGFRVVISRPGS